MAVDVIGPDEASLALGRLAIAMLAMIWAEELRELELRMHHAQPRWAQVPGYETWLRWRFYPWAVRSVALAIVLLQVGPLLRRWLA
jgi:hypothetical protein